MSETTNIKINRMKELTAVLRQAGKAYYTDSLEIMSNLEYDRLYDELLTLEQETGVVLSGSPTTQVGYETLEELPKERHEQRMLSLDKTKEVSALSEWLGEQKGLLSWKMDGLTIVLTYQNGKLMKAVTRGNGEVGEVITNNAKVFQNLPHQISFQGELILRGEAVISYSDFEKINETIDEADAKYKNPRNLCSGSVRQLNNAVTAARNVRFYAFSLVRAEGVDFKNSREQQFLWMKEMGFEIVEYRQVSAQNMEEGVQYFAEKIKTYDIPSDGLVLLMNDIAYGEALGTTAKFPRNSIAFKWKDELAETVLTEIEWSPSRTGLINPVAIFNPVELEGTTVSRASVHNISIMKGLELGIGDKIKVYKANMIIPQIAENLTRSGVKDIPSTCPACGQRTELRQLNDAESLYCPNPGCSAKHMKAFTLLVSRNALNIEGLSQSTLEKFIALGVLKEFADLFFLKNHQELIQEMEGFGEKSYQNLIDSIEKARKTTLSRVIYGLGIPNIGVANAKMLCKYYKNDMIKLRNASAEELSTIDGIGPIIGQAVADYFQEQGNRVQVDHLLEQLVIEDEELTEGEQVLEGIQFVITGAVHHFPNRAALKELIEKKGGKVTGSVTSKTNYLINNDSNSSTGKNKKAKELGISILTEEDFLERFGNLNEN